MVAATKNTWQNLTGSALTDHTQTGLSLKEGGKYSMRVGALNKAGFLASFETNGVIVDSSEPMVCFILFCCTEKHHGIYLLWMALFLWVPIFLD